VQLLAAVSGDNGENEGTHGGGTGAVGVCGGGGGASSDGRSADTNVPKTVSLATLAAEADRKFYLPLHAHTHNVIHN
jgi:hypothetical protein